MGAKTFRDRLHPAAPFLLVILVSAISRFYNLMNPLTFPGYSGTLSKNGSDEGIFLMTSRLVERGSGMYVDINTHQGPLFSYVFQLLDGDPAAVRVMTVIISLIGITAVMMIAYKSWGKRAAVVSSILLSFNFVYFKVSRQASFDLYCAVLLILGFLSVLWYYRYRGEGSRWRIYLSLFGAGIFLAAASMSKLFAVIPIISLGIYMLVGWLRERDREGNGPLLHLLFLTLITAAAALSMMFIYGFQETLDGMLLSNLGRTALPLSRRAGAVFKFTLMALVPLVLASAVLIKVKGDRTVHLMTLWLVPLFIFILFQSAIWDHYLMIILPPLCLLAGIGFEVLSKDAEEKEGSKGKNPKDIIKPVRSLTIVTIVFMIISVVAITGLVLISDKSVEQDVARDVSSITSQDDIIISGDPIIGIYADRLQPAEATNIAMVRSPPLEDSDLINISVENNVKVVVFTYNLANFDIFLDFIRENFDFLRGYTWTGEISDVEGEIPIDMDTFNIYVRPDDLDMENARDRYLSGLDDESF